MRNLLIGAATAVALVAGPALAADPTYAPRSSMDYSPGTTIPQSGASGTSGYGSGTSGNTWGAATYRGPSGSTYTAPPGNPNLSTTSPMGGFVPYGPAGGDLSARANQTANGTHCPPGTPDCGPTGN